VTLPLPLAGEVDALDRARRVGEIYPFDELRCGGTPTPTLPRKREREQKRKDGIECIEAKQS
jgi:hypothetical protein